MQSLALWRMYVSQQQELKSAIFFMCSVSLYLSVYMYLTVVCDQVTWSMQYYGFSIELRRLWLSFTSSSERYAHMRNEEKKGAQDRPLGTPEMTWRGLEETPFTTTYCIRFVR